MKTLITHPIAIYLAAGLVCLNIMIIVDYILGAEAEHLNAWAILNRIFGADTGIPDSLAIRRFGLYGAAVVALVLNLLLGSVLIQLIGIVIRVFHS